MRNSIKQKTSRMRTVGARPIAGFWQRGCALLIDCVILFLIGRLLGFLFSEQFARLGSFGQLIGYGICIWYFGWLNSSLGGGQTMGKRFLSLCVIDQEGEYISPGKSYIRAALLAAPVLKWGFPVVIALVYFYVFNRITRQSLHDLLTGTFVVKTESLHVPVDFRMWPKHYAIFSAVVLAVVAGGFYLHEKMTNYNLGEMRAELAKIQGIDDASAAAETRSPLGGGDSRRSLTVTVITHDQLKPAQLLEDRIVEIVLKKLPSYHDFATIRIQISKGYDIGIAKHYRIEEAVFSPRNPRERIRAVSVGW